MAVYKFHQFVVLEKGLVNTAVIDLIQGDIYLAPNKDIENFYKKAYPEIPGLIDFFRNEKLIIETEERSWIPRLVFDKDSMERAVQLILEIEEGADLNLIVDKFSSESIKVKAIHFYGNQPPIEILPGIPVTKKEKTFVNCLAICKVTEKFEKIDEHFYQYNMKYNSCWGNRIAVTKSGEIRPCIYSEIIIGDLRKDRFMDIIEKHREFREITKDKVEECKDCELRYSCFDCREIAQRKGGTLNSPNPHCQYDPYKGEWGKKDKKI